jgi:hypothetical protein
MKKLLTVTSIFEGVTGLALMTAPTLVVSLLLGAPLVEPAGIFVCRLTGASLLTLAMVCWLNKSELQASGLVKALLFYNVAAAFLLVYASLNGFPGLGIWPASLLHFGLAAWCIKYLQNKR